MCLAEQKLHKMPYSLPLIAHEKSLLTNLSFFLWFNQEYAVCQLNIYTFLWASQPSNAGAAFGSAVLIFGDLSKVSSCKMWLQVVSKDSFMTHEKARCGSVSAGCLWCHPSRRELIPGVNRAKELGVGDLTKRSHDLWALGRNHVPWSVPHFSQQI